MLSTMSEEEKKTEFDIYHILKLTEENYRTWTQQLRWILNEKELLKMMKGAEIKPMASVALEGVEISAASQSEYETRLAT